MVFSAPFSCARVRSRRRPQYFIVSVLFAALFLGEQVTPALLVGGAVILAGVIISNKGK